MKQASAGRMTGSIDVQLVEGPSIINMRLRKRGEEGGREGRKGMKGGGSTEISTPLVSDLLFVCKYFRGVLWARNLPKIRPSSFALCSFHIVCVRAGKK